MATELSVDAVEQSTYVVTIAFTDEDGNAVAPDTATWTLTDDEGTVINLRQDVTISSPSATEEVLLTGDDLAITDTYSPRRIFTIEATYTSGTFGAGLPLTGAAQFTVERLVGN